jgi:TonB family protein
MTALVPAVLSLLTAASALPTISPADAAKYVGKEVVVVGTIDQMATTVNLTTHINFGGRYPNHVFTATILRARQPLFSGVRELDGKLVEVQGVVKLYRNKPEIMLTDPTQIRLARSSATASGAAGATGPPPAGALASPARDAAPPAAGAGAPAGAGPTVEVSDPSFDAMGVDFAEWIAHFKAVVGRQWRKPDASLASADLGPAEFDFVVERNGSMSAFRRLKSSGNRALDRAAGDALTTSRLLPLPEAYPASSVMMRVTFAFGAAPSTTGR